MRLVLFGHPSLGPREVLPFLSQTLKNLVKRKGAGGNEGCFSGGWGKAVWDWTRALSPFSSGVTKRAGAVSTATGGGCGPPAAAPWLRVGASCPVRLLPPPTPSGTKAREAGRGPARGGARQVPAAALPGEDASEAMGAGGGVSGARDGRADPTGPGRSGRAVGGARGGREGGETADGALDRAEQLQPRSPASAAFLLLERGCLAAFGGGAERGVLANS